MDPLRSLTSSIALALVALAATPSRAAATPQRITYVDPYTLYGPANFLTGYETRNADGTYNMAVEIPTGTSAKWETCTTASLAAPAKFPGCTEAGREMVQEVKNGARRVLTHLGYPGNYGSMPRTRAADGDPLDVVAIGPEEKRGLVMPVKVVGVIRCLDGEDQDDKIVAITEESPLYAKVSTAAELEAVAPKAAEILFTWYENYKGAGAMTCAPMEDEVVAAEIIAQAQAAFVAP